MKTRRYHLTKAQGDVASCALASAINELQNIIRRDPSPYWPWLLERSKQLKRELDNYQWEVTGK